MRVIPIDGPALLALFNQTEGPFVDIPVSVDWSELQLTNEQRMVNALAALEEKKQPFPDPSVFILRIPIVVKLPDEPSSPNETPNG